MVHKAGIIHIVKHIIYGMEPWKLKTVRLVEIKIKQRVKHTTINPLTAPSVSLVEGVPPNYSSLTQTSTVKEVETEYLTALKCEECGLITLVD